jgi:signal transduction histidine kinase
MQWSIRNQILVPLIAIQAAAVTAIAVATATLAARRTEREIIGRLNGVLAAVGQGGFPYTASVLSRMRGLSGAHFIAATEDRRVMESTLALPGQLPAALQVLSPSTQVQALADSPAAIVAGTRYFAALVRSAAGPGAPVLLVLYPETRWRQARNEAAMPPLMLGAGALGVMVLVTSWIAHRISRRIHRVERQVACIASGDFRELQVARHRDEVDDLAESVNQMCRQLRDMRQTIRQSEKAGLLAQIAAGLAHQLRNALTGARLSIQLHARRCPARDDETLTVALRQLAITEEQVRGLLSVGRGERQAPEVCELHQVLDDVVQLLEPTCRHARISLVRYPGGEPLPIMADRASLRAAILNLALNAIEAAGAGGTVTLEAQAREKDLAVEIVDSGPGPPPELAETLFEAFVTSKPEGAGLGLALARQVAVDHGGALGWTRQADRTRFHLTLPRTPEHPRSPHESHPDRG